MADYTAWPERFVKVQALQLDAKNPRIPGGNDSLSPRQLITELVQHDDVHDLARDIVADGYNPVESLIGLEEDGRSIILEGNRRLAALKLLLNPDLAPDATWVGRFKKLSARATPSSIAKVRVLFAPSREDAAPLILRKHTREQIERWSPLMQARFYVTLATDDLSIEEIASRYRTPASEILGFLRLYSAYEVACRMDLPDDVREIVRNPREFPAAVLERLLAIPAARQFLGIDFDARGGLRGTVHKDEFVKGYGKVLTDIARKDLDTRRINKVEDAEKYLKFVASFAPDKTKRGRFAAKDFEPKDDSPVDSGDAKPPPGRRRPKSRFGASVIPRDIKCRVDNARIKDVFDEARQLKADKFANSSAILIRIILELGLAYYLEKTGKDAPLREKAKKDRKPDNWSPPLRSLLGEFLKISDLPLPALKRKAAQRILASKDSPLSVDDLDCFVHNPYVTPKESDLRGFWAALEGVFAIILEEPPKALTGAP